MKKTIFNVVATSVIFVASASARPVFGYIPDWESADERSTIGIALADFNGDGWQYEPHEWKEGDGERHVFYLDHWPALTIESIYLNGELVPRSDYCFDARAGWYSFKEAPGLGTLISVNYVWSNRLDFFAGNEGWERVGVDNRDVIYFNDKGKLGKTPGWLSENHDHTFGVAEADFDRDGDVDVAITGLATRPNAFIKVYKNTGSGLEMQPSWTYIIPHGAPERCAWGDIDNDGYLELAVADGSLDGGLFCVFKNNGGVLDNSPSWSVKYENAVAVAWGDMDRDGDMDLAGGTYRNGYAYVFKNNKGILEDEHCWRNAPPAGVSRGLAWGDVNGDGEMDLVKSIQGGEPIHSVDIYFSENGILPFSPDWESGIHTFCHFSVLADCDEDGALDLIYSNNRGAVGHFHRTGGLEKYPSWDYDVAGYVHIFNVRIGDINGDGYADVAAGCAMSSGITSRATNKVFLNKANIGIKVKGFAASACDRGVALRWGVNEPGAGFNLFREVAVAESTSEPKKINAELITGRTPYSYIDADVNSGNTYCYWLEVVPLAGAAERHGPVECTVGNKASFALAQNAPNPARNATTVAFSVPTACEATVTIYDMAGRKVAVPFAGVAVAGANEISVDVSGLAPGVYAYRLEAGGATAARRMVVIK